ncbi:OPT oligopeptide transporter protein-domain-containing protein [Lipomyces tetrasporus]
MQEEKTNVIVSALPADGSLSSEKDVKVMESPIDDIEREKIIGRIKFKNQTHDEEGDNTYMDAATEYLFDKVMTMSLEDGLQVLKAAAEYHFDDVNFPELTMKKILALLEGPDAYDGDVDSYELDIKIEACMIKYHSPYPEVRAVCDPYDDPELPVETIRMYILGVFWVSVGAFVNEFFHQRQPRLNISSTAIQLLLYPCGKLLERICPDWGFTFRGTRYSLNPGPWTHKEQMLATLMVNVGSGTTNFASYAIVMRLDRFFGLKYVGFGFMFLMNLSSLFFGFGLAGILRRWVIYPVKVCAVWPTILPTLALNRALLVRERRQSVNGWTITKYKFFFVCLGGAFLYFFIPSFVFRALGYFNWITWIDPQNVKLAIITGSYLGLGFNPIATFDWSIIDYSSPLVVPFFSLINRYMGMLGAAFLMIGLYWTNYKWTGYLPINSSEVYDSTGAEYNVSRVAIDQKFYQEGYENYSPPYISIGNLIATGAGFAVHTLALTYVLLTEHKLMWQALKGFWTTIRNPRRSNLELFTDPHSRMMARYPEVPDWWFGIVFVVSFVAGVIALTVYPTQTPVWAVVVILIVSLVMLIPSCLIYSITGYQLGFHNLAVIITGYMIPGNGIANMMCRLYGWNIDDQAESYISDQKMGHYTKLPPRAIFRAQMLATFIQTFITIGVVDFSIYSIKDFCSYTQVDRFICTFPHSLYADTIMFGIVGPVRMFNSLYPVLKYSFLIGFLIAFPCWALRAYFPKVLKYAHPVLIISGVNRWGATYNLAHYTPGLWAGFAFNFYLKRHYLGWWTKYNYVLTSALSAGVAFSGMFIFLTLQYTSTQFVWWGNTINQQGVDYARKAALYEIPESGFGAPVGSFH